MNERLEAALQYAARGWAVLPLNWIMPDGSCSCGNPDCGSSRGKHPRHKRTGKDHALASTDPATIEAWWRQWPQANVGIVTGAKSGLFVLDVDGAKGRAKLAELLAQHGPFPRTLAAVSGRPDGGAHIYFHTDTEVRISASEGLDVRCDGGLVVAPPSMHYTGNRYRWHDTRAPLAELPAWLLDFVLSQPGKTRSRKVVKPPAEWGTPPAWLAGLGSSLTDRALAGMDDTAPVEDVLAAAEHLSSAGLTWKRWNDLLMALWASNPDAREAAHIVSRKSDKYDAAKTDARWDHFPHSPPNDLGFGSIVFKVREIVPEWIPPSKLPREVQLLASDDIGNTEAVDIFQPDNAGGMNGHSVEAQAPLEPLFKPKQGNPLIKLNEKHSVIGDIGGKCLVMSWVPSKVDETIKVPSFQSFKSFSERYGSQYVTSRRTGKDGDIIEEPKQLGSYWLKWPGRKSYEGIDLVPNGASPLPGQVLNLWSGFAVEPKPGDWPLMRRHIGEVLADGDPASAAYIAKFAAWAVQHPGERAEVALVFRGGKGSGKGTFANALKQLFGQHGLQIFNSKHLTGAFNGHLRNCLLLFADEAFWAGDKQGESVLKGLITEPALMIEQKGVDAAPWRNRLHVIMAANAEWVVPASHDERRYAMFDVSDKRAGDRAYFDALHREIAGEGLAAMLHDLMRVELGAWHPRDIVRTEALRQQKERSMDPRWEWWEGLLQDGLLPYATKEHPDKVAAAVLLEHIRADTPKLKNISATALGRFLGSVGCLRMHEMGGNSWRFPPLNKARSTFEERFKTWNWHINVNSWRVRG